MSRLARNLTATLLVALVLPAAGCSTTRGAVPGSGGKGPQPSEASGPKQLAATDAAAAEEGRDGEDGGDAAVESQQSGEGAVDEAPAKPSAVVKAANEDSAPKGEKAAAKERTPKAEKAAKKESSPKAEKKAAATAVALELPEPIHKKIVKTCGNDPGVGKRLKSFRLETPDGKPISPGKYRGRVLLVNFWGTWCEPCLKELPKLEALYRRYRKYGLTLVAIATDEEAEPVKEIVRKKRMRAKVAIGGESYAESFDAGTFPFSFVVDGKYRGYKPECMGKLEADVRRELEKRNR
jgi:thiol-disulfide isomerase/thioredoxin